MSLTFEEISRSIIEDEWIHGNATKWMSYKWSEYKGFEEKDMKNFANRVLLACKVYFEKQIEKLPVQDSLEIESTWSDDWVRKKDILGILG